MITLCFIYGIVYTRCYYLFEKKNMLIDFNDGIPVSLEQVLLAKEQRVQNQQSVINQYQTPIISLTLVIPGPVKNSPAAKFLFKQAINTIHQMLMENNLPIVYEKHEQAVTGFEAIIAVDCIATHLKQLCIEIEHNHPLGRLWDIDIIDPITQMSIPRTGFELKPRKCLICGDNAKACGRGRRHSVTEIFNEMTKIINSYNAKQIQSNQYQ